MRHVASMLIATAAAVLLSAALHAQGEYPLTISTSVLPPYSPSIANYFSSSSNVAFVIFNSTTETKRVYLAGSITRIPEEDLSATVDGQQAWSAPPLIVPPGSNYFTGDNLVPILNAINGNPATLVGDGLEDQLRLGVIPEGEYELCLRVYDYDVPGTALSADGCRIFTIRELEPPEPLAPSCQDDGVGEMVTPQDPQFILFNWFLPGGVPPGVTFSYEFRLVRIESPTNAQAALETSTDVVYETSVPTNQLIYTQMMPALEPGRMYAWWVRAVPFPSDAALVRNNGYMRPCTFTYQEHGDTEFGLSFPVQQDTLPWDLIPIMARFEPHAPPNDDLTTGKFWSRLDVYKDGAFLNRTFRHTQTNEIDWGRGYYHSQMELLGNPSDFTEEQARHINIYTNSPDAEGRFKRGSSYALSADLRTKNRAGLDVRYGDAEGVFVSGMGRPRPLTPANNALLPKNGGDTTITGFAPVMLRFQTADEPMALRPPFPIRILYGSNAPTQTHGQAHERWRLEVSRSATMTSPILVRSKVLGPVQLIDDACNDACVKDQFYRLDSVEFAPADTGTYYWRVAWLQDPGSEAGTTYHDGPVRMFRVVSDTAAPPAEEEVRPRECVSICRAAPTPMAQRVPVTSAAVTDTIAIGLFRMRITEIVWAGGTASGEGLIPVPFMNCPMKVSFTDAQINAQKVMYQGDVYGRYDNESIVPAAWRMGAGLAAGFSPSAVQQIDDYLNATGRLTMQLTGNSPMGLPIGIAADVPGGRFTVGIVGMQFTDTVAKLNAMMSVPVPELGFNYGLGVTEQVFHPDGVGCPDSDAMLYLVDDVRVGIGGDSLVMKGTRFDPANHMAVVDSGTYAAWDCRGFRALQIDAQWRFDREHLKEDRPDGTSGPEKIVAAMKMRTGRGGLMGRVDFNKPFHIDGAEGWGFDVQEAWLDMASYANPPEMVLPPDVAASVESSGSNGLPIPSWRGFYLKRAMLRLPDGVKRFGSTERVTGFVDDLVIGANGVTGSLKLVNLIDAGAGDLAGWAISIDTLQMDIVANSFHEAGLKGRMRTSVSETLIGYSAMLVQDPTTGNRWIDLLMQPQDDLSVPFLASTIDLEETSTVRAAIDDPVYGTYAEARLYGKLTLDKEYGGTRINFRDIEFQNLRFSTDTPYTNIHNGALFSFTSPQKYMGGDHALLDDEEDDAPSGGSTGGFPISITQVKGERTTIDGKPAAGIAFDINLQLTGQTNVFTATTRVAVLGTLNTSQIHQWGDNEVRLDSVGVRGNTGAVEIEGGLRWYRDSPTYGNGIRGRATAWFMNRRVMVNASTQFGTKNDLRYWYVDALASWTGGLSPGSPFNVYGFGGAAWYKMRRTNPVPPGEEVLAQQLDMNMPDSLVGYTSTGNEFLPDAAHHFGLEATVVFGDGGGGRTYNGDVALGASFTQDGGLTQLYLNGNVYLISTLQDPDRREVPVRGLANITYDVTNEVLAANFDVFVNIKEGLVVGTRANDLAGRAALLITPDVWNFKVGTPQTPIGLRFAGFFQGENYFMVGEELPAPLPPPAAVASVVPAGYMDPDPMLASGSGIGFGARFNYADTVQFLLFELKLAAGAGFDLTLRDVGTMECHDIPEPGVLGWYAGGQAFAHVSGDVSLYVDIKIWSGRYHLFGVDASAMLRGGFVNPSWLKGSVHGEYSILHGWVSGSVTFPFELGEPCSPPSSGLLTDMDPIADLAPDDLAGLPPGCTNHAICGVDCGVNPEALFNHKVEQTFTVQEQANDGTVRNRYFRFRIAHFLLERKNGNAWSNVTVARNVAPGNESASINPSGYLQPEQEYRVRLKLVGEERFGLESANDWRAVANALWERTHRFKTDKGIDSLRASDIDYTAPITGQRFYLQDECAEGIVMCLDSMQNQPLFISPYGRERRFRLVFVPLTGGAAQEVSTQVEHGFQTAFRFNMPHLLNDKVYTARIVARDVYDPGNLAISGDGPAPQGASGMSHSQITAQLSGIGNMSVQQASSSQFQNTVQVRRRSMDGYNLRPDERIVFVFHFRTSKHNTMAEKAAALTFKYTTYSTTGSPARENLEAQFYGEPFDVFDANGYTTGNGTVKGPLVATEDAHTDGWYKNWAKPVMYDYYDAIKEAGCSEMELARTTTLEWQGWGYVQVISDEPDYYLGIPPTKTVKFEPLGPVLQALSASETTSPSASNNPLAQGHAAPLGGLNADGPGSVAPANAILDWGTGKYTAIDYSRLLTITTDVRARCGLLEPDPHDDVYTLMPEPLRSKLLDFQASSYRKLHAGQYGIRFRYFPPACVPFTDGQIWEGGTSGIAYLQHPTGITPTPPRPGFGAPSPGGGVITK